MLIYKLVNYYHSWLLFCSSNQTWVEQRKRQNIEHDAHGLVINAHISVLKYLNLSLVFSFLMLVVFYIYVLKKDTSSDLRISTLSPRCDVLKELNHNRFLLLMDPYNWRNLKTKKAEYETDPSKYQCWTLAFVI